MPAAAELALHLSALWVLDCGCMSAWQVAVLRCSFSMAGTLSARYIVVYTGRYLQDVQYTTNVSTLADDTVAPAGVLVPRPASVAPQPHQGQARRTGARHRGMLFISCGSLADASAVYQVIVAYDGP